MNEKNEFTMSGDTYLQALHRAEKRGYEEGRLAGALTVVAVEVAILGVFLAWLLNPIS